jgi:hypothetical protein
MAVLPTKRIRGEGSCNSITLSLPYTTTFVRIVKSNVPSLSAEAQIYLEEAVGAFYAGCMLASCVMSGVAAEAEFLNMLDAVANGRHSSKFAAAQKSFFIRKKIEAFQKALQPMLNTLPAKVTENLETNLTMIQSVLRLARNDAGHPTGASPEREQVFIYLQLFAPFAKQLVQLRDALV